MISSLTLLFSILSSFSSFPSASQNDRFSLSSLGQGITLSDSCFLNSSGQWVDRGTSWIWDNYWSFYNCYSFAIQRFDLHERASYDYYYGEYNYEITRQYRPGWFQGYDYDVSIWTESVEEGTAVVAADLEYLGFQNVSYGRLSGSLPSLSDDDNLIAIRYGSNSGGGKDFHFMVYDKEDGHWYHKPHTSAPLRYKYAVNEGVEWTNESVTKNGASEGNFSYSGQIWIIKYSNYKILVDPLGRETETSIFVPNFGVTTATIDIPANCQIDLSFRNINGFYVQLYSNSWDGIVSTTYGPVVEYLCAGRYYLVMSNLRYNDYVYITSSFEIAI